VFNASQRIYLVKASFSKLSELAWLPQVLSYSVTLLVKVFPNPKYATILTAEQIVPNK
jgi:hypothetical protein